MNISNEGIAEQSRIGNLMASITESRFARGLAAGALVTSVGGLAIEGGSAAASMENGQQTASMSSVVYRDGELTPQLGVTPVNDMYDVYAGVHYVAFGPLANDTPNGDAAAVEAVQVCDTGTPDAGITFEKDPYIPDALRISIASTVSGEHHSTITLCNPEDGSSATSDVG